MRLICDAIAFCYGPGAVLRRVLHAWRPWCSSITLVGTGTTLEFMSRSGLVDRVISADTEDPAEAISQLDGSWDVLLSVCNPVGYSALRPYASLGVYWDFLLWMRHQGPAPEFDADLYVVEMFPTSALALDRWGPAMRAPVPCPVLAEWREGPRRAEPGSVVLSLGGQRSRLTRPGENTDYPSRMVGLMQEAARRVGHKGPFTVCADARTAAELATSHPREGWRYQSLSHDEFLDLLDRSERVITHPGLYAPFESIGRGAPTFFLPSSNYTQILQLDIFRGVGLAPWSVDWPDLVGASVPAGLPEPEGVARVLELVSAGRAPVIEHRLVEIFGDWLRVDAHELARAGAAQRASAAPYYGDFSAVLRGLAERVSAHGAGISFGAPR